MSLAVAQPTIAELRTLVDYKREAVARAARQVPEELETRVRGLFLQLYLDELRDKGVVEPKTLFKSSGRAKKKLRRRFRVEHVDDRWFLDAQEVPEVQDLAERIRKESQRRTYPKGRASALHDATLLTWVEKEREEHPHATLFVTLDGLLCSISATDDSSEKPLAIRLDALLQWIWPAAVGDNDEAEVAQVFAEALQLQLLPEETFFQERDFLMLDALQMQARHLPASDVEASVKYLKKHAIGLDPTSPKDRERIAHLMGGFFADPSRDHTRIVAQQQQTIVDLTRRLEAYATDEERRGLQKLQRRRTVRALLSGIVPLLMLSASFFLAGSLGDGATWLARLGDQFHIPAIAGAAGLVVFRMLLGRAGLQNAHWMIRRLFFVD